MNRSKIDDRSKAHRDKLISGLLFAALIISCIFIFWFFSRGTVND